MNNHFNYPDELMKPDSHIISWQQSALAASFTNHRFLSEFNKVSKTNCISPENLTQNVNLNWGRPLSKLMVLLPLFLFDEWLEESLLNVEIDFLTI
ncbi:hypothetical protein Bhyg_09387 [Pseudolycoriella hygida]|uniref:Uncharacterized protein n=1 Tax=Pseudolycoriella hygida TaxID=35572 RepID=A0A9Q0N6D3_9DIPT|nr:hypothetical protein Bhyg_09387 [Pseudolycoriella hygida]